jgi:hypothetical protein
MDGQLALMRQMRSEHKILFGKLYCTTPFVTFVDNIEKNLKVIGVNIWKGFRSTRIKSNGEFF